MEIAEMLLVGGVGAAVVKGIEAVIVWMLNRKATKEDTAQKEDSEVEARFKILELSQRVILCDRIRWLGRGYIADGTIDLDDLKVIKEMHDVYHSLGGNGTCARLMAELDKLPIKQ